MSTSLLSGVLVEYTDCFSALSFHLTFQRCLNTGGGTLEVILSKVVYELCHSLNAQNVDISLLYL